MIDALHDPGTPTGIARTATVGTEKVVPLRAVSGSQLLIGVASWTDPSMTAAGVFYPDGATSPEARLRYYASRFPIVEVDSTYYAIPARRMAEHWAARTPEGFVFNVKAHALMTGQPSETSRLPKEIRAALPAELAAEDRIYATALPVELRDAVWREFQNSLTPLRDAGRMGAMILQFPRWVGPSRANAALIQDARARLHGWDVAIEFRNRDWLDGRTAARTLDLLRRHDFSYVAVDAPPGFQSSVPAIAEATSPRLAVIRFHGRNTDTWEAKVKQVNQRFRYLYDEAQLREWLPRIRALSEQAEVVHLVFNNCYGNYATTNALEMSGLLVREGLATPW